MFSFGSDPEFMVVDKDGQIKSAIGIVQGTKNHRVNIRGHEFFYDNVLAECAIKPGKSKDEVLQNFRDAFQIYSEMVRPFKLLPQAACKFPKEELRHPAAFEVGCDPDMCAYRMKQMSAPTDEIQNDNLRTGGGHIHLGHEVLCGDGPEPIFAMFMLDLFVATPSVWVDCDSTSSLRKKIYGEVGRYRTKSYGLEYRPLSNFWTQSPRLVSLIYDLSNFALEYTATGKAEQFWSFDIETYFNTNNLSDAFACRGYDPEALARGFQQNDKAMLTPHLEIVKRELPSALWCEVETCFDFVGRDFEAEWNLN